MQYEAGRPLTPDCEGFTADNPLSDDRHAKLMLRLRAEATRHAKVDAYYSTDDCPHDADEDHERHLLTWIGWACLDRPAGMSCQECESEDCDYSNGVYWAAEDFWWLFSTERADELKETTAETAHDVVADPDPIDNHTPFACEGRVCSIHRPPHPLVNAPMHWRADKQLMERTCAHGIGHPDPNDLAFKRVSHGDAVADTLGVHGCDGCCTKETR